MTTDIEVSYAAGDRTPRLDGGRPVLTWGRDPEHGHGWTLWHLSDPGAGTTEVGRYFIPGDLTDVDIVVRSAQAYLERHAR